MKSKIPKGLDVLNISIPDVLYLLHQIEAMQFLGFHSIHKKNMHRRKICGMTFTQRTPKLIRIFLN